MIFKAFIALFLAFGMANSFAMESVEQTCVRIGRKNSGLEGGKTMLKENPGYQLFQAFAHPGLKEGRRSFSLAVARLMEDLGASVDDLNESLDILMRESESLPRLATGLQAAMGDEGSYSLDKNGAKIKLACASVGRFLECPKAIRYLLQKANSRSIILGTMDVQYLFPNLFIKVLSERNYAELVGETVRSLVSDIQLFKMFGYLPIDNIFDRIIQVGEGLGYKKDEAKEFAFEILGAYSIRATSLFSDNSRLEISKSKAGHDFLLLSALISYLDKEMFASKKELFSLPWIFTKNTCNYGKPYHFWMAAYLSHLAKSEGGFSVKSSFYASHLMGLGYELDRHDGDVNGSGIYFRKIVESKNSHTLFVKNAKVDIFFNSLGAYFGATEGAGSYVDSDKMLTELLERGSVPPIKLDDRHTWMSLVAPNSHLKRLFRHHRP